MTKQILPLCEHQATDIRNRNKKTMKLTTLLGLTVAVAITASAFTTCAEAAYYPDTKTECLLEGWESELAWRFDLVTDMEVALIDAFDNEWLKVSMPICDENNDSLFDYEREFEDFMKANGDKVLELTGRFVNEHGQLSARH